MKIGINGYEAVVPRFGYDKDSGLPNRVGSGEFCFQLLLSLYSFDKKNEYSIYLPIKPSDDFPRSTDQWRYKVFSAKKLWTLIGLSKKLRGENLDVFFSPTHYLPVISPKKSIIAIFDVSYLHFPNLFRKKDLYQLKAWGGFSIKKSAKIITISKASKSDIIKAYGVNPDKVAVVYPGLKLINTPLLSMENLTKKFGISKKYILFVGTIQPRKNIVRLIEAFAKLKNESLELVIVGKKGWQYKEIFDAPKKFEVDGKVRFLDSVSDDELSSFYKNAEFFILPSLYEGFGLPVIEAMSYGCPVITSNISSLPEAGGDAALYVDPNSVTDIASKMQKLLNDEELKKELIEKGYKQAKKFSWEKSAKETLRVLESL